MDSGLICKQARGAAKWTGTRIAELRWKHGLAIMASEGSRISLWVN